MLYEPIRWLIQIPRNLADTSVSAGKVLRYLTRTLTFVIVMTLLTLTFKAISNLTAFISATRYTILC